MSHNMRREFSNRDELIVYLREQFPQATETDNHISEMLGGRKTAEVALAKVDPLKYGKTRNFFKGAVTYLSPYLRYGVISLREVRDFAVAKAHNPDDAIKLVNELGWRDYWQRLYLQLGDKIWEDQEEYKTGYNKSEYASQLAADIREGKTGLVCIDSFSDDLRDIGYLHNHARMWIAAYVVHFRRIRWQAGAKWFLEHLLDGDPASNNMSWQWVASTFSHKPYFFNRENLEKYTEGVYCQKCPLYGNCDFEGSYEELEIKLFPKGEFSRQRNSQSWQKGKRVKGK
ncbi:FAD-binding domain-containing protein [Calothrix sp. UHCC 0171]|uniref:FAD-binding domain-containing protein n=1 Tax=Calothrix sp. UHCC 0171 TaxID=3110245 RepID=UPI002B1FF204|nr:FAD-binding domain-containing protein [Calothrix sp. UHCC 0171]MEA5571780.1 FAD-binding domain-containing protein [Calothrix sp. UHCC 0171]